MTRHTSTHEPVRRALLRAAGVGGAATGAATVLGTAPARAASGYRPARYRSLPLLPAGGRLLVSRFSYGITPGLARQVDRRGGARAWWEWQLSPELIGDSDARDLDAWWPYLADSGLQAWQNQVDGVKEGWELMFDYGRWVLLRRMVSNRQLLEVMTEFWENHFNVPANGDAQFLYRKSYGDEIRKRALGSFEDLLHTTTLHPAMLLFLNQAVSTASHPNENLGRELLELHTVGRGSYTEDDVKGSARILTGYMVDMWRTWEPSYQPRNHWVGPVQVMDFSSPNADKDGRPVVQAYLSYLAHHPATATRVARKLAIKFVSDNPSDDLVAHLADVYLANGTQIKPVLRALVASEEFKASDGQKLRDPGEDVVASYRAIGARFAQPAHDESAANAILWQAGDLGTAPFAWPRPDGQPITNDAWTSASRLVNSMGLHMDMAGGWWPTRDIDYPATRHWFPELPIRFDKLVDHLSQVFLHRHSTSTLLQACCEAVTVQPDEKITRDHAVARWNAVRLLTTFLDSPAFFAR